MNKLDEIIRKTHWLLQPPHSVVQIHMMQHIQLLLLCLQCQAKMVLQYKKSIFKFNLFFQPMRERKKYHQRFNLVFQASSHFLTKCKLSITQHEGIFSMRNRKECFLIFFLILCVFSFLVFFFHLFSFF